MNLPKVLNIDDMRELARRRLPRGIFEYIDRGTEDEVLLATNRRALDELKLLPSVLVDVSDRTQHVELLGHRHAMPLAIAPTAVAGLVWHEGEVHLARAAAAVNIPFCISTQSITSIERIAESGARLWFQLYVWRDRELTYKLIDRARAAGADTLVLTADTVVSPKREYNVRNGFGIPLVPSVSGTIDVLTHPRWFSSVLLRYLRTGGIPTYAHYPPEFRTAITRAAVSESVRLSDTVTWDDLVELRRRWPGRLVVKGILRSDDAARAANCGADGIVVSNHGGRNLDAAPSPIEVLPQIVGAVGEKLTVMADSGVRRGSDVIKMLALGARAVLVGRSVLFGTAVGGEAGATRVLQILREEIDNTMAILGRRTIADICMDLVHNHPTR